MSAVQSCPSCGGVFFGSFCPTCADAAAPKTVPAAPVGPGRTFRDLEILEVLGQGGMGVVYKARQMSLDRIVALKTLPPGLAREPQFQERFEREAKAMAALSHPNIVTVHEFGRENDVFFFAMEYVEGGTLRTRLAERRPSIREIVDFLTPVCDALEYAHGEGVVHRDIKPDNLLIDKKGRVKIADFGLVKLAFDTDGLTQTGAALGTAHYMAPEQFENPFAVDRRADIYALGVILYEMLTGKLPLGRFEPPSRVSSTSPALDAVVLQALAKDPDQRFPTVAGFKSALLQAAAPAPTAVSQRRSRLWIALPIALGLALAGFFVLRNRKPREVPSQPPSQKRETPPARPFDLETMVFGPEEAPLGRNLLPRYDQVYLNPFLAKKGTNDVAMLAEHTRLLGVGDFSSSQIVEGYGVQWVGCDLLVLRLESPKLAAAPIKSVHKNFWSRPQDSYLVIAFAKRREDRAAFVDLVDRVRKKMKLPAEPPPLPAEFLAFGRGDLPEGWTLSSRDTGCSDLSLPLTADKERFAASARRPPEVEPSQIVSFYCAAFERSSGTPEIRMTVLELVDAPVAARLEREWRAKFPRVLRANATLALFFGDSSGAPLEKIVETARAWMGLAPR